MRIISYTSRRISYQLNVFVLINHQSDLDIYRKMDSIEARRGMKYGCLCTRKLWLRNFETPGDIITCVRTYVKKLSSRLLLAIGPNYCGRASHWNRTSNDEMCYVGSSCTDYIVRNTLSSQLWHLPAAVYYISIQVFMSAKNVLSPIIVVQDFYRSLFLPWFHSRLPLAVCKQCFFVQQSLTTDDLTKKKFFYINCTMSFWRSFWLRFTESQLNRYTSSETSKPSHILDDNCHFLCHLFCNASLSTRKVITVPRVWETKSTKKLLVQISSRGQHITVSFCEIIF